MNIHIEQAAIKDYDYIASRDIHLPGHRITAKIAAGEIQMLRSPVPEEHRGPFAGNRYITIGLLRYGYFWDNTPFVNLLWLEERYRNMGAGRQAMEHWEDEMKQRGYRQLMTSSLATESAQHFYRKLGYKDAGSLLLEGEPLEILFTKYI